MVAISCWVVKGLALQISGLFNYLRGLTPVETFI